METRHTPTGYQHALELRLRRAPETRFTDPFRALEDLNAGMSQPVVEVVEKHANCSVRVRVSVFGQFAVPTASEAAALTGLAAELTFADHP